MSVPPWLGPGAVLFAAFASTLTGRLTTFGLADIRGALGLSVDEGAWINTAQAVAQMLIAPLAVWAASVIGPRRVLLAGCVVFAGASALMPFSNGLLPMLALQFASGLGSGCFAPLAIMVVLRGLPPRSWVLGIALYALTIEASLNVSASLEGFYIDRLSWAWIFWQNVPFAIATGICVHLGLPRVPIDRSALGRADWFGMVSGAAACSLLYAALDQGNRLDWLGSGVIVALFAGGVAFLLFFIVHELTTINPWVDLRMLGGGFLPLLLLLVCEVRFASLGTAYLVPQFLSAVRGLRPPEIGDVLIWLVISQLAAVPLATLLLRIFDSRWIAFAGMAMIATACWITATHLTAMWSTGDFLGTQLLQALGQTMVISAVIFTGVLNLRPSAIPTFGVAIQFARLLGGEIGFAFLVTFVRASEQVTSHVLGTHVQSGGRDTLQRLQAVATILSGRIEGAGEATAASTAILAQSIRAQANLLACIEGFAVLAASGFVGFLLLLALDRAPRGPASPNLVLLREPRKVL